MSSADVDVESSPYLRDPPTGFKPAESLSRETAEGQAALLRETVRERDHRYYVAADPLVSDAVYDTLFSRLVALEDALDPDATDSPTSHVDGEPIDALETVGHVVPMLSIGQSTDADDLREFDERARREVGAAGYVCELKFDDLSVEVVYEDDEFVRAATRGDGRRSDDMNTQVRTIPTVPLSLHGDHPDRLTVRSEIYMPKSDFDDLNARRVGTGEDTFADPRNVATGTFRNLDPSVIAGHPLTVPSCDILDASARSDSQWAALDRLREWGLRVTDRIKRAEDMAEAIGYCGRMQAAHSDLDYKIDGTVIKVDSRDVREQLGKKSRSIHWAFACKFPTRHEVTAVRGIVMQVGRTSRLTPVAVLDPVNVGGVTVSQAVLHNPDERAALGVVIGDHVHIKCTGDVIPQMVEVIEDSGRCYGSPDGYPVCGSTMGRSGPLAFYSGGLSCPAQRKASIDHFAVEDAMGIDGLGGERVAQLVDTGLVKTVTDLYGLTADDLTKLEGWGGTNAENLMAAIKNAKRPSLDLFFIDLSIPEVGEATTRGLTREFGSIGTFPIGANAEENEFDAFEEHLTTVPDVGETVACRVRDFFENADSHTVIRTLFDRGIDPEPVESDGDELDGLTFVVAGALTANRDDVTELVESHGGNVTGSVSGNTDYLVVGENPDRSERDDAEANNVPTLTETEFEALLTERGVVYPSEQNGQLVR